MCPILPDFPSRGKNYRKRGMMGLYYRCRNAMHIILDPEWHQLLQTPESDWSLSEAALLVAQQLQPELDRQQYRRKLEDMVATLAVRVDLASTVQAKLAQLNRYFYDELGFIGNAADYYNPENSYLNKVLDYHRGIPITLSLLYMKLADAIGLDVMGVNFPGRFLVAMIIDDDRKIIDPYDQGKLLDRAGLLALLKSAGADKHPGDGLDSYLVPTTNRIFLVRLLRNLKNIFIEQQNVESGMIVIEMILSLLPESPDELRDRGMIYHHIGYASGALVDLQRFLVLQPDTTERTVIEAMIKSLEQQDTPLH